MNIFKLPKDKIAVVSIKQSLTTVSGIEIPPNVSSIINTPLYQVIEVGNPDSFIKENDKVIVKGAISVKVNNSDYHIVNEEDVLTVVR